MMKLKMKLTFWPAVLGALLFETLILPNQAQAQTEQFRAGVVRALPGQLDRGLMINDNNPEVVKGAGILLRDYPLVQGIVVVVATLVVLVSLLVDVLVAILDPRIKF